MNQGSGRAADTEYQDKSRSQEPGRPTERNPGQEQGLGSRNRSRIRIRNAATNDSEESNPVPTQGTGGAPGTGGPPPLPQNVTSNKRLQQTQAQMDEVVDIMRVNVDKVLKRDQKLMELDDRADALQAGASQFETSTCKLRRKYWWKNCKMMIILGAVCAIMFIIIISEFFL
ncbi:vesicle-associated membrane protein 1-like [Rhinatrema bivittatum]|uniref:vesicle-associated membrane protein 1-like n=1 Tax=Rhinatrema bivittatum TaxID=194408 RepID=UPI001126574A|nr:vesicle-associated membrane protein 1-like [Rhinatrema bivittatum]